jgi:uncharacterized cupin superfamily protein
MRIVNTGHLPEAAWSSPGGTFATADREISVALGREPASTDLSRRHPFDVEICRIPRGKASCPYHSHSAQWEYYQVISGTGTVRHADGVTAVEPGDAFLFGPGMPHQVAAGASADLVLYLVADNPMGESCHYPDSGKWLVRSPERALIRSKPLDYLDGEE